MYTGKNKGNLKTWTLFYVNLEYVLNSSYYDIVI